MYVKRADVIEALTGWDTDPTDDEIEFTVNHLPSLTKVYQLHEYSGSYEDYRDLIRGTYLSKERAEVVLTAREMTEQTLRELSERCFDCPFSGKPADELDELLVKHPDYCPYQSTNLYIDDDYDCIECKNYYQHWDEATFEVVEVEVEV